MSPWRFRWAPPWPTSSPSWRSNMTDTLVRNQHACPSHLCRQPRRFAGAPKTQHPVSPAEFLLMSDRCGGFEVDGPKIAKLQGVSGAPPDSENKHLSLGKLLVSSSANKKNNPDPVLVFTRLGYVCYSTSGTSILSAWCHK